MCSSILQDKMALFHWRFTKWLALFEYVLLTIHRRRSKKTLFDIEIPFLSQHRYFIIPDCQDHIIQMKKSERHFIHPKHVQRVNQNGGCIIESISPDVLSRPHDCFFSKESKIAKFRDARIILQMYALVQEVVVFFFAWHFG